MDVSYEDPRSEYLLAPSPGISLEALAEKWDAPLRQLTKQCTQEGWVVQRRRLQENGATDGQAGPAAILETPHDIANRHRRWWRDVGKAAHKNIRQNKQAERFEDVRTLEMIGRTMKIATDGERLSAGMDVEGEEEPRRIAIEWLFPPPKEGKD